MMQSISIHCVAVCLMFAKIHSSSTMFESQFHIHHRQLNWSTDVLMLLLQTLSECFSVNQRHKLAP